MEKIHDINTIQYLGSKSRIINDICKPIADNIVITRVIDLFAGTGSVGYALKDYKEIISNDIEYYSYVINQAILNGCMLSEDDENVFWSKVNTSFMELSKLVKNCIEEEDTFFCGNSDYRKYQAFCENTPSVFSPHTDDIRFSEIAQLVAQVKPGQDQKTSFYWLFLTYYANAYFGIRQCCQIDAISCAIHQISNVQTKYVLLTALMSVMSATASTTAHFAQHLKVKNNATYQNLIDKVLVCGIVLNL